MQSLPLASTVLALTTAGVFALACYLVISVIRNSQFRYLRYMGIAIVLILIVSLVGTIWCGFAAQDQSSCGAIGIIGGGLLAVIFWPFLICVFITGVINKRRG